MDVSGQILEHLEHVGECSYAELTKHLGVSTMTIRRRVAELCDRGVATKMPGGVRGTDEFAKLYETTVLSRLRRNRAEKKAIAAAAASQIQGNETIFLDGSTTCLELARKIIDMPDLTVVTNSALLCLELGRRGKCRIMAVGGQYDPTSLSCCGPTAENIAKQFFPDIAFFSTQGFLPGDGTYESSEPTFRIKQIVAEQGGRVILLADHTKFGQCGLCKVLDVTRIGAVITDSAPSRLHCEQLKARKVKVVVA